MSRWILLAAVVVTMGCQYRGYARTGETAREGRSPADCAARCREDGMEFSAYVYLDRTTTACVCSPAPQPVQAQGAPPQSTQPPTGSPGATPEGTQPQAGSAPSNSERAGAAGVAAGAAHLQKEREEEERQQQSSSPTSPTTDPDP